MEVVVKKVAQILGDFGMCVTDAVRSQLEQHSFFTVWENLWGRMTTEPGGDMAMVILLKQASAALDEFDQRVISMSEQVIREARFEMTELEDERHNSREENRKMVYGDVERPESIYRRWMKPLRWIQQNNTCLDQQECADLIRDIMEEQTLPFTELDNPDYVDSYTGEIEEVERIQFQAPEDHEDFSEAFDSEDGLDEEFYDEYDVKPWTLEEMQQDFQAQNFSYLSRDIRPLAQELRTVISETLQSTREKHFADFRIEVNKLDMKKRQEYLDAKKDIESVFFGKELPEERRKKVMFLKLVPGFLKGIFAETREDVRNSPEANAYLLKLQEYIDRGEFAVDVALLFLSLQHGLCFEEFDARAVRLLEGTNLFDYIEDNEDEILENVNNPSGIRSEEPSRAFIDAFCEDTLKAYAALGKPSFKAAPDTPQFIEGVIRAASTLRDVSSAKLNAAGHEAWRYWMSHAGNEAFYTARCQGADYKAAMREFWKVANKTPRIATIRPTGLVLTNGRFIDWKTAVIKVDHREIELYEQDKEKLRGVLTEHNFSPQMLAALA